ncbi:MAG: MerR family transcriptional regulator [Clostridia bacterium]|nr:MerR family transcriptional regulator [Clostridia bacterium]
MLKIGEFAKICNVSAQTLRFYDAEGVLCADFVDQESGYRYYEPEKINTYRRIVMLKDIGFSLDEIKLILGADGKENAACEVFCSVS